MNVIMSDLIQLWEIAQLVRLWVYSSMVTSSSGILRVPLGLVEMHVFTKHWPGHLRLSKKIKKWYYSGSKKNENKKGFWSLAWVRPQCNLNMVWETKYTNMHIEE